MPGRRAIDLGWATHPGQVRELNEDTLGLPAEAGISGTLRSAKGELLAIADGMGGHAAGEVASQQAIATLYARYYYDPSPDSAASLRQAVERANAEVHSRASSGLATHGMGTTLVAAIIKNGSLIVANVGDSRAYLLRKGEIRQISHDHSWVAESQAAGLLTPEQARTHRYRNLVTRALGQKPEVEVDVFQERLRPGDVILLCSDGLTNEVQESEIADLVARLPASQAAAELVELANRGGGRDNISVVLARVSGRSTLPSGPALVGGLAAGLVLSIVALYLLASARPWGPWLRAGPTTTPVAAAVSDLPTITAELARSAGGPTATDTVPAIPEVSTTVVSALSTVTDMPGIVATEPLEAGSTPLPTTTLPITDTQPARWLPLGPVIRVPLRWGCHHVDRCDTGEDALAGLLTSFGYEVDELELKLQELSGGLVLDLSQRVEASLARSPVVCMLGVVGGVTVHTQKEGQYYSGEMVMATGDGSAIVVTITRSDLGVPCQLELVSGDEVIACGYRARPVGNESRLVASLVARWSETEQPEVWLPQDEPMPWISGEAAALARIGLSPAGAPEVVSGGESDIDLWLVYTHRHETTDRCQLGLRIAEFEPGSFALFAWDAPNGRFVYSGP